METPNSDLNSPEIVEFLNLRFSGVERSEQGHMRLNRPCGVPLEHGTEDFEEIGFRLLADGWYAIIERGVNRIEGSPARNLSIVLIRS